MPGILDKLNQELESIGKRAQAAFEEGRFQIELMRLRHQRDHAASELGLLVHRRERGGEAEADRIEAAMRRLDDLEAAIARIEAQMGAVKAEAETVDPPPAEGHQEPPPPTADGPAPAEGPPS